MVYRYNELELGVPRKYWVVDIFNGNTAKVRFCETEREAIDYAETHLLGLTGREMTELVSFGYVDISRRKVELNDDGDIECDDWLVDSPWSFGEWLDSHTYEHGFWKGVRA